MNLVCIRLLVVAVFTLAGFGLQAQDAGIVGYWKEPGGSVIHVAPCAAMICATLVTISPDAPSRVDRNNQNEALRQRTLCGLRIGESFQWPTTAKAEGGTLYDPKSGKTYHGRMESHGDKLDLRGYIGLAVFGRTETWTRVASMSPCTK